MRTEGAKLIMQGLQANKAIRDQYKEAYIEIKNFLRDVKKKPQDGKTPEKQSMIGSAAVNWTRETNQWASFATQNASFSTSSYSLANSFILDCGSPVHICNDID